MPSACWRGGWSRTVSGEGVKRVRVRVSGRVQGVFFRDTVSREASARDVAGWVRNCSDGTVEAMVGLSRRGPRSADVHDVEASDEEPEGLEGFDVR